MNDFIYGIAVETVAVMVAWLVPGSLIGSILSSFNSA